MSQTVYSIYRKRALEGLVSDLQISNIINRTNMQGAYIPFGAGLFFDGQSGAKLGVAASKIDGWLGVSVRSYTYTVPPGGVEGVPPNHEINIMNVGVIWVTAVEAVTANDKAYVRIGTTKTGGFCKSAGSGATLALLLPGAKFLTSGGAGSLVELSIAVGIN